MNTNNISDSSKGWDYICALFYFYQNRVMRKNRNSHIYPRYIYRGISRRHFTDSACIEDIWGKYREMKESGINDKSISKSVLSCIKNGEKDATLEMEKYEYDITQMGENKDSINRFKLYYIKRNIYFRIYSKLLEDINKATSKSYFHEDSHQVVSYVKILERFIKNGYYVLTEPEHIRSGASIRLGGKDGKYCSTSDYISYITTLIADFKNMNPKYQGYKDLEILAEIQHKGGASCLVDFSNNFLISLWFACSNDFNHIGYIFCYDINSDALKEDNITIMNPCSIEEDIENILLRTKKSARYVGDDNFRFWLWTPANLNGRIGRQDSIFVFGIEKFIVKDHNIEVIPIPPKWKSPIIHALKTYFGICAETVFPDTDGFASAHSKLASVPCAQMFIHPAIKFGKENPDSALDIVQHGMSCLLKGEYDLALEYFFKSLIQEEEYYFSLREEKFSEFDVNQFMVKLEVLYSIGFCYKKIEEYWSALKYLRKAFVLCFNIITNSRLKENLDNIDQQLLLSLNNSNSRCETGNFIRKFLKIIDDYMDVIYEVQNYEEGIKIIPLLMHSAELQKDLTQLQRKNNRNALKCVNNCLLILNGIKKSSIEGAPIKPIVLDKVNSKNHSYCNILNRYLLLVASLVTYPYDIVGKNIFKAHSKIQKFYKAFKDGIEISESESLSIELTNLYWNFNDIIEAVELHFQGESFRNLRDTVSDATANIETIQRMIQSIKDVNQ